jgi:hypothetical protein
MPGLEDLPRVRGRQRARDALPQLHHVGVQRAVGGAGHLVAPQLFDERRRGDHPADVEREHRQQLAWFARRRHNGNTVDCGFERAQHVDFSSHDLLISPVRQIAA